MPLNRRLLFCPSAQLPEPLGASDATRLSHGAGEAVWLCLRHVIGSRTSPEPQDSALLELVPSSQEGTFSFLTSLPVSTPRDLGSWSSSLSQVWPPLGQQWLTPHHAVPFFTLLGYSGHYPHKRCYVFLPRSTAGCRWYSWGREEHCLSRGLLLSGGQSSTAAVLSQLLPYCPSSSACAWSITCTGGKLPFPLLQGSLWGSISLKNSSFLFWWMPTCSAICRWKALPKSQLAKHESSTGVRESGIYFMLRLHFSHTS